MGKFYGFRILLQIVACAAVIGFASMTTGCGGSNDAERERVADSTRTATQMMMKQMDDLRGDNASLKTQLNQSQSENRTLKAHSAELETQLADLRSKMMKPVDTVANVPEEKPMTVTSSKGKETYDEALGLFKKKKYGDALAKFQAVATDANAKGLADHSDYWSGECLYALKEFDDAIDAFTKVLAFGQSSKKDDAQMMIGNSYMAMGNKAKAKEAYTTLVTKFPASPYVKAAKKKLAKL
ncbi:MAG TPA: tetratricopeptide repeat protein [Bacteroidota bacterium]|nr:tetratricopeptide repeat protein [Bacteroidota bacterium]